MNKKVLEKAVGGLINRLESTEKFVLAQAPEICKQIIQESRMEAVIMTAGGIIFFVILSALSTYFYYKVATCGSAYYSSCDGSGFVSLFSGIGALVALGVVVNGFYNLLFIKRCPKLILLRQFKNLIP